MIGRSENLTEKVHVLILLLKKRTIVERLNYLVLQKLPNLLILKGFISWHGVCFGCFN